MKWPPTEQALQAHTAKPSYTVHTFTKATTLSRLLYATPAWNGYLCATDLARIDRLISRLIRISYLPQDNPSFSDLVASPELNLLNAVIFNIVPPPWSP